MWVSRKFRVPFFTVDPLDVQLRGGWSRFSRNVIIVNAHHMPSMFFADSAG